MTIRTLPAGLIDNGIEFFNDPSDIEKCYILTGGFVARVNDASDMIKQMIDIDIAAHPEKVEALVLLGYESADAQREKYCSCVCGDFDGNPDVVNGRLVHHEYWPCPHRGVCPVEGRLCNALVVGPQNKYLTKREIEVLTLKGQCLLNKEIADRLSISEETVKIHVKHIQEKSGLMNSMDLVKLAITKNLVS